LGTWEVGGVWWGPLDAKEGVKSVHHARELGVTTFKCVLSRQDVAACVTGVMNVRELTANVRAAEPPYSSKEQLDTLAAARHNPAQ